MKNGLSRACLLILGITLAVGCGPAAPEDMQEYDSPESTTPQTANEEATSDEGAQVSEDEAEEDRGIGALEACCFIKCKGDAAYRGPYRKVTYGNCTEYGRYYCGQRHLRHEHAKWADCRTGC
jgi:hypothetical protein